LIGLQDGKSGKLVLGTPLPGEMPDEALIKSMDRARMAWRIAPQFVYEGDQEKVGTGSRQ
jgi:hypothetical protein